MDVEILIDNLYDDALKRTATFTATLDDDHEDVDIVVESEVWERYIGDNIKEWIEDSVTEMTEDGEPESEIKKYINSRIQKRLDRYINYHKDDIMSDPDMWYNN